MDVGATRFCAQGCPLSWDLRSAGVLVNRMVQQLVTSESAGVTCVPWNTDGLLKMSRALADWPDDYASQVVCQ